MGYEDGIPGNTPRYDGLPSFVEWTQPVAGPATAFFQYDVRGQLTQARLVKGGGEDTAKSLSIEYDTIGNILSLSRGGAATRYQYETATRRLQGVTGAYQGTFAYDAAGQLLADSRFATSTSSYSHFSYSPLGYTESVSNSTQRLRFVHDASGQKVATYHEALAQNGALSMSGRHFVRNPTGEIVAEYKNGQLVRQTLGNLGSLETGVEGRSGLQFYLKDLLGSVRVRLHESGDVLEVTDFDAFGVEWADRSRNQDGVDGPRQFTGYTSHKELPTPFFHANARLYDANLGRFFRPDPLSDLEPVTTAYAYARNAPTALVDPTGLYNRRPKVPIYYYESSPVTVTASRITRPGTYQIGRDNLNIKVPFREMVVAGGMVFPAYGPGVVDVRDNYHPYNSEVSRRRDQLSANASLYPVDVVYLNSHGDGNGNVMYLRPDMVTWAKVPVISFIQQALIDLRMPAQGAKVALGACMGAMVNEGRNFSPALSNLAKQYQMTIYAHARYGWSVHSSYFYDRIRDATGDNHRLNAIQIPDGDSRIDVGQSVRFNPDGSVDFWHDKLNRIHLNYRAVQQRSFYFFQEE